MSDYHPIAIPRDKLYRLALSENVHPYECIKYLDKENFLVGKLNKLVDRSLVGISNVSGLILKHIRPKEPPKALSMPPETGVEVDTLKQIAEDYDDISDSKRIRNAVNEFGQAFVKEVLQSARAIRPDNFDGVKGFRRMQEYIKDNYKNAQVLLLQKIITILDLSIGNYMSNCSEENILKKAEEYFRGGRVRSLSDFRNLSEQEISGFYDYLSGGINLFNFEILGTLRKFFNFSVAIMVCTNIPLTGLIGAGANMLKTSLFAAREASLRMASFGIVPKTKENLYRFTAEILNY